MSILQVHIKEISKTLAPEYGPESPSAAMDRLFQYYKNLRAEERTAFVMALIGEVVLAKTLRRAAEQKIMGAVPPGSDNPTEFVDAAPVPAPATIGEKENE